MVMKIQSETDLKTNLITYKTIHFKRNGTINVNMF